MALGLKFASAWEKDKEGKLRIWMYILSVMYIYIYTYIFMYIYPVVVYFLFYVFGHCFGSMLVFGGSCAWKEIHNFTGPISVV